MPIRRLYKSEQACQNSLICRNRRPLSFFVLAVILILAFIFFFVIYPRADITLVVASQPLKTSFEVKLDAKVDKILGNLDIMPAQAITFSFNKPDQEFEIKGTVDKKLEKKIEDNQILLPELIHYAENERGDIEVVVLVFEQEDVDELLDYKFTQIVASDKELMESEDDVLHTSVVTFKPNELQGVIDIYLEKTVIPQLDFAYISQKLVNQLVSEVESQLRGLAGVKEVKIETKGVFFKKMPLISKRIKVKLDTF